MNKVPPSSQVGGAVPGSSGSSMRIGQFWKRAIDAPQSEEPFDALTDLFLGEVGPRGASGARRDARKGGAEDDQPKPRLTGADDDGGYALAPDGAGAPAVRSNPFAAPAAPSPRTTSEVSTLPAGPVLVVDKEDDGEARPIALTLPPPARNPVLDLLVLGNLPVMASAWASQYAREVAAAAGKPVAYLHVQGGYARLELVGTLPEGVEAPPAEGLEKLDAAIDGAAELTDRWIVRCDAGSEKEVVSCWIARAVTILTGIDPMAREACKPVFAALGAALKTVGGEGPMVRLGVMGAGGEQAALVSAELAAAAGAAMARPVAGVVCSAKLGANRPAMQLFNGPVEETVESIVESIERALTPDVAGEFFEPKVVEASPESATVPALVEEIAGEVEREDAAEMLAAVADARPTAVSADVEVGASEIAEPVRASIDMVDLPLPEPKATVAEIAAGIAEPRPEGAVIEVARPVDIVAPKPALSVSPTIAAPMKFEPSGPLSVHVGSMRTLALRCPYAEGVELAIDAAGGLHLLARSSGEVGDDAALAALLVASSWAESHAALIGPGAGILLPQDARPTLHLFTDRPKRSRRLLETNVRVHVLAPVKVGEAMGWYCAELN